MSSEQLKGSTPYEKALVQQFTSYADNEILPASYAWVYPSLSVAQFNKSVRLNNFTIFDCIEISNTSYDFFLVCW